MSEEFIDMKGQPRRELERELALNYDLEQVVADLVDNSIDARAENVEVIYNEEEYNGRKSFYVIVLDDGKGIPDEGLNSVMNFGAPREYDELELGKFGVGMKSSSLSQAREVTLISKVKNGQVNLRRLSSEVVMEQDRWTLLPELRPHMKTRAIDIAMARLSERDSGSAIVLEDMHKLKYRVGNESNRDAYLQSEYGHIKDYLSLVFENYIRGTTLTRTDGTSVDRSVNLFFNGTQDVNKLDLLDPFCKHLQDGSVTGTLSKSLNMTIDDGEKVHQIPVTIWITPNDKDRGQEYDKRMDRAARFAGISELQGIYVYRNGRLIDFPGWKKILKHDPHMTCLRWEMHFPPSLDHVFQLDPSKREVQLPRALFEQLTKLSRTSYRWHGEDQKSVNHRARARTRQGGKDKPIATTRGGPTTQTSITTPRRSSTGPSQIPQRGNPSTPSSTPAEPATPSRQALQSVRIKKLAGSITGQLFVSERQDGDKLSITLNTNHALYRSFIDEVKKE